MLTEDIIQRIKPGEIVDLTSRMIRIPSHKQAEGREQGMCSFIREWFESNSIDYILQSSENMEIPIGVLKGRRIENGILLNGHMDTANVDYMDHPYSGNVDHEWVYGRGATDMKGALASMMVAFRLIKEFTMPSTPIVLYPTIGEETGQCAASIGFSNDLNLKYAIVGEPTGLNIATRNKGLYFMKIVSKGRSAHLAVPSEGVNAIGSLITSINVLETEYFTQRCRETNGESLFVLCGISGGSEGIPDYAEALYNRRTIKGDSFQKDRAEMLKVIHRMRESNSSLDICIEFCDEYGIELAAMEEPIDKEFVRTTVDALQPHIGSNITIFPGWTEGSIFREKGIDTLIFGPGHLKDAHTPNEKISNNQLYRACEGYIRILTAHNERFEE